MTVLASTTMAELAGTLELGEGVPEMLAANSGGLALLGHGQTVSAKYLLTMACEAQIIPVVFNDAGGVLAYGRTRRLASADQRLALAARDGGCCFPGCDRPAAWTEVHHVTELIKGGATDVANMCLLCVHHHHSFEQNGWEIVMRNGAPWWLPPPWLDPARTPRRNTTHHRPDIVFRQPGAA